MLDREQLETFATVAEEQSFEKAALKLNITRGAVSQRLFEQGLCLPSGSSLTTDQQSEICGLIGATLRP